MSDYASTQPSWNYYNPVRVVGTCLDALDNYVPPGNNILLVTTIGSRKRGVTERLLGALRNRDITVLDDIAPNPDLRYLDEATNRLRHKKIDLVIALGGGSVLDAGKTLSLTLSRREPDPLKRIFRENVAIAWTARLPLVTIPTTAGTGAEVTPFATVWDHEYKRKHSVSASLAFPDLALLDVGLTLTLPPEETLYPGLDTVSHALESLWNRNVTPVSRALAMQALALAGVALRGVIQQPDSVEHRTGMQQASLLAGLAISQTRTSIAHAISYPLTIHYGVPHGLACSFTLSVLLRANLSRIPRTESEHLVLRGVLALLDALRLDRRLLGYLKREDLHHLLSEMFTAERSNNYDGADLGGVGRIIDSALKNMGIEK